MANNLVSTEQVNASFQGMTQLPVVRQVGLLLGLAASIALGIYVALWSQTPNYSVLISSVAAADASEIIQVLEQKNIGHQYNTQSGVISVEAAKVHEARMALAAQGLPRQAGSIGFELLEKEQGFGTSAFIQNARYHRALEGELGRTITTMAAVSSARVHLALPKESAFIRDRREASASVMLKLHSGRKLETEKVAAITHLVASSVPNMDIEQVTVVDDKGNLLSDNSQLTALGLSTGQFEYSRRVEQAYIERIEDLLSPIVGAEKVRAQVVAEMDFSQVEYTKESYNPDLPAVRSEQRVEERSNGSALAGGIPGALSNEPPGNAQAPEQAVTEQTRRTTQTPTRSSVRSTRNFELDKTISHTKRSPGTVRRLSVAVVLDHKLTTNDQGETISAPYTDDELQRFTSLVKDAVGFDAMRGDSVNVTNAAFTVPPPVEAVPEPTLLEQPWVWDLAKQIGVALLLGALFFAVLRPVMRNLSKVPTHRVAVAGGGDEALADDQLTLSGEQGQRLPKPNEYESDLEMAKSMVVQEPKRVAQVVKQWVNE